MKSLFLITATLLSFSTVACKTTDGAEGGSELASAVATSPEISCFVAGGVTHPLFTGSTWSLKGNQLIRDFVGSVDTPATIYSLERADHLTSWDGPGQTICSEARNGHVISLEVYPQVVVYADKGGDGVTRVTKWAVLGERLEER